MADALSRLTIKEGQSGATDNTSTTNTSPYQAQGMHAHSQQSGTPDADCSFIIDDEDLLECFLAFPDATPEEPFLLDYEQIAIKQRAEGCHRLLQTDPKHCSLECLCFGSPELVVCNYDPNPEVRPRMRLPDSMVESVVQFYHLALSHIGMIRLQQTISANFQHPKLNEACMKVALPCEVCQKTTIFGHGHGHLPVKETQHAPWQEVAVDLIGPWILYDQDGKEHSFTALTIVDTVATYCEIVLLENKTAKHVGHQFEAQWLARCPHPARCIFDQGNEFLGEAFQQA